MVIGLEFLQGIDGNLRRESRLRQRQILCVDDKILKA
jgi:hypothetical protein